jgi:competence protein ComEA
VPALQAQTTDAAAPMAVATASPEATQAMTVNINSATASELAAGLKGVGPGKAEAIVRYREQFGAFESIDELAEVKGIGAATVEQNRSMIVLR